MHVKYTLAALLVATSAHAQTKTECAASYEQGQQLRRAGKLQDARAKLRVCTAASCAEFERVDCDRWLGEVEASMPTIVFRAVADGRDLQTARIELDGTLLTKRIDGRSVEIDPGENVFRIVLDDGRAQEKHVTTLQGQKDRVVDFVLEKPAAKKEPEVTRPVPFVVYPLAGAAVVGLGLFTGFAIASSGKRSDLQNRCAPVCTSSDVDGVKTLQIVADVSLIVGVVSLAAASFLYLTRPERVVASGK